MMCCDGRCGQTIAYGPSDPDNWFPDLDWLEDELESANPPKLVYIVNPCNPTGQLACKASSLAVQPPSCRMCICMCVDGFYPRALQLQIGALVLLSMRGWGQVCFAMQE